VTPARLLFVHAHPDDETIATGTSIAHYAGLGHDVHVLTCTLGEEGEVIPPELRDLEGAAGDPLAEHRRGELAEALAALGATGHLLGDLRAAVGLAAYRDSGMAGTPSATHPRALVGADLGELADVVGRFVADLAPDLVVTYDPHGGYAHPDHIRVHELTRAALGALPEPPPLYAVLTPVSWAREDRQWLTENVDPASGWTLLGPDDPYPPSVVDDHLVTHVVVDPVARQRQAEALRRHPTQATVAADGESYALSNDIAARLSGREGFVRVDLATGRFVPGIRDAAHRVGPVEDGQALHGDAALGRFRQAMGRNASGIAVLTTSLDGLDHAMTANTLTSISLDPMLVLVSIEQEARFHDAVLAAGIFGATVLAEDQRPVAAWFATRGRPLHGQLDRTPHRRGAATGVPLLDGGLSCLECRVVATYPAGDHTLVLAEVMGIDLPDDPGAALVHFRGDYRRLS
jgi:N-acetyl-1-D-myo-inositol-2-amino-2-deoxy-alpha-D-glucopyranoside deacetylase